MDFTLSKCIPGCDHTLTPYQFEKETHTGDTHWRRTQVVRVLGSFEAAKRVMSRQGIHQVYVFLKAGRWISAYSNISDNIAYRALKQRRGYEKYPRFHYPRFLVVQAIYGSTDTPIPDCFMKLCLDMSHHWGIRINPSKPFYPRLEDSEKELALMKGVYHEPPKPKTLQDLSAQSASIPVVGSYDDGEQSCSIQKTYGMTGIIKPEPVDDDNFLQMGENHNVSTSHAFERRISQLERNFERRMAGVQRDLEHRVGNLVGHHISKYQAQLQINTTRAEEDHETRLSEAREKLKEIHQHALRAQKHADMAVKMAEALYESLTTATKRPVSDDPYDDEHSSKRVRGA
ncbi:hypothetical protein QYS62_004138 [Fusarium acuminatum]|uniref:Uncharacterized protein n=1 Tax=Fusarium acuminatum TaxID=5515 RepID=A0ABZ2WRE3_9HYPO